VTLSGSTRNSRLSCESGSVLATVLVVMVILLTIFLSAMTYALSRYSHHMARQNSLVASHLADAGIAHAVAGLEESGFKPGDMTMTAPNGGQIKTSISTWGPYVRVHSSGEYGNQVVTTEALVGTSRLTFQKAAVTVGDENNPLVIAGHTRVIGDVNTGSQGIMEGQFRGEGVTYTDYHIGNLYKRSSIEVPSIDTSVYGYYKRELTHRRRSDPKRLPGSVVLTASDNRFLDSMANIRVENDLLMRDVSMRYFDEVKTIAVDGTVEITGHTHLSGLIEIVAEETIFVRDSAVLDNVVLIAGDSIVVSGAASSSAILISEGKIVISDRATLVYPSLLLADVSDGPDQPGGVYLQSRVPLETIACLRVKPFQTPSTDRLLYVDTLTTVRGTLLSQGYVDLRGHLEGCCITERFHFEYPPTTYVNWLKDAYIDRSKLDYTQVLPSLTSVDSVAGYYVVRQECAE
jgi:hypothetical protein